MRRLRLALLGGFRAQLDDGSPVRFPTRKSEALLAYLALPSGRLHTRDELANLLWGDSADSSARKCLRQTLFLLRQIATRAGTWLIEEGVSVALDRSRVSVDVDEFEQAVCEGKDHVLTRAEDLYCGELLHGVSVSAPAFEEWLRKERERLQELAVEALAKLVRDASAVKATDRAIQGALKLLSIDPLQESIYRTLMRLYVESGRRAAALRCYETCAALLGRELRVKPELETWRLYQQILGQRAKRATPSAWRRRVECLPGLAHDRALVEQATREAQSLFMTAQIPESLAVLSRQQDRAERLQDSLTTGVFYFWLGHTHVALEQPSEGFDCARRAADIAEHHQHPMLMVQASFLHSYASFAAGRPDVGIGHGERAIRRLESLRGEQFWLGAAWLMLGLNRLLSGDVQRGLDALRRAEAVATASGAAMIPTMSAAFQADACIARGEVQSGFSHARRAFDNARSPAESLAGAGILGATELARGDMSSAIARLESGCRHPFPSLRSLFASRLSEAQLLRGNLERAASWADRAVADSCRHAYATPRALRIRGRVAHMLGAVTEAGHDLTQALNWFARLGDSFESGYTHLCFAELAHAGADHSTAIDHLVQARDLFTLSNCREYVERADAMAGSLGLTRT